MIPHLYHREARKAILFKVSAAFPARPVRTEKRTRTAEERRRNRAPDKRRIRAGEQEPPPPPLADTYQTTPRHIILPPNPHRRSTEYDAILTPPGYCTIGGGRLVLFHVELFARTAEFIAHRIPLHITRLALHRACAPPFSRLNPTSFPFTHHLIHKRHFLPEFTRIHRLLSLTYLYYHII